MKAISLKAKYTLFFSGFLIVSFTLLMMVSAQSIISTACRIFAQEGQPIVEKAAGLIPPSIYKNLVQKPTENNEYYEEYRQLLLDLKESTNCYYLYTMAPKRGTTFQYIIDGSCDPSDTENFSPIGTEEDITSYGQAPIKCMETKSFQVSNLEKQEGWGWMVSVFYPILDVNGSAIGFAAADFNADEVVQTAIHQIIFSVITSLVLLILIIVVITIYTTRLFNKIQSVSSSISDIANGKGDLTQQIPVKTEDEIGRLSKSCNALTSSLSHMIQSIKASVTSLSNIGKELEAQTSTTIESINAAQFAMIKINERAGRQNETMTTVHESSQKMQDAIAILTSKIATQATAINQSSAAIEEVTANIEHIDDRVENISKSYQQLVQTTESGRKDQKTVTDTIKAIAELSSDLVKANTVIDDIAQQTNLLAMNAAIEAAHAGESGKGFAVVATEIRTLAENSSKQSASISQLVQSINESINATVKASTQSVNSFTDVTKQVEEIDQMLNEVRRGMEEERKGAQEMLKGMGVITNATDTIKSASSVMTEQSQSVVQGIEALRTSISDVKELAEGAKGTMGQISADAEKSGEAARKNQEMSSSVLNIVNTYKTGI